jgi:hypothetical protein
LAGWTTGWISGIEATNLGVPASISTNSLLSNLALVRLTQLVPNRYFGRFPRPHHPAQPMISGGVAATVSTFRGAFYRNNVGHSTYHSLQRACGATVLEGLTFYAAAQFSGKRSTMRGGIRSAIPGPPRLISGGGGRHKPPREKDESTGSIPHVFSGSFVWEIPAGANRRFVLDGWRDAIAGGWQLSGIVRLQSGSPLAVTQATNLNAFAGFGIQRPNRIADTTLPSDERTTAKWFNTAAFTQAPQFTIGNSSRIRGGRIIASWT